MPSYSKRQEVLRALKTRVKVLLIQRARSPSGGKRAQRVARELDDALMNLRLALSSRYLTRRTRRIPKNTATSEWAVWEQDRDGFKQQFRVYP